MKKGLKSIQTLLLNTFNIKSSIIFRQFGNYICLSNYDSLKKFCNEIGFVIKRKQEALKQLLDSYKRKGLRKYPEEFKLLAIELLNRGLKHRQIAKLLGTNHTNIYDWEKRFLKDL